jgi:hypothetical protein
VSVFLDFLATLAGLLPWLPGVIAVVAGLIGLGLIRKLPRSDRVDRGDAKALAGLMAPVAGIAGFIAFAPVIFDADPTPFFIATAIGAVLVAFVGYLAGIAGYALLARPGIGRRAVVGALLGPLLFAGATLALRPIGKGLEEGARNAAMRERAREVGLSVRIETLDVTMAIARDTATDSDIEAVDAVTLTITIRTDIALGSTYLRLYRPDSPFGTPFHNESIDTLDPGTVNWRGATFRKSSAHGNSRKPGEWMLELYTHDASNRTYDVRIPLMLPPS